MTRKRRRRERREFNRRRRFFRRYALERVYGDWITWARECVLTAEIAAMGGDGVPFPTGWAPKRTRRGIAASAAAKAARGVAF